MFKKKSCKKCSRKVNKNDSFCPDCGNYLGQSKVKREDWGMLGKDDHPNREIDNSMLGGFSGKIMNKLINSTMKMIEKEMQKSMNDSLKNTPQNKSKNTHFELYINGKKVNPENMQISQNNQNLSEDQNREIHNKFFTEEKSKKFSELPKESPKIDLRRLSDQVTYEINLPGVKSLEDVSIVKLESSIEVKAISKSKAYSKIIPVSLGISNYALSKERLIIELE